MDQTAPLPTGRLKAVERDWEYQSGWVRAPLREIVFNERLSKQARLVWLWLASLPELGCTATWNECESLLNCKTKARRNCILQLVTEGYVSVSPSGIVVMHDPYEVYSHNNYIDSELKTIAVKEKVAKVVETIPEIIEEPKATKADQIMKDLLEIQEKIAPTENKTKSKKSIVPKIELIIEAWNECKPQSYSSLRSISIKQQECITKHMKNLGLDETQTKDFICKVCSGLLKSNFWTNQVRQETRNFRAVFGYGAPLDKKMKNIEDLYNAGEDFITPTITIKKSYTLDQQELIDAYRYSKMNYENSSLREDLNEQSRWLTHLDAIVEQLEEQGIDPNDI